MLESLEGRQLLATVTTYPVPSVSGQTEVISASNKLWFTQFSANAIGSIDPSNPEAGVTIYGQGSAGNPLGITKGPDDDVWFTQVTRGALGKLDPDAIATGIQSFAVRGRNYVPVNNASATFLFNATPSDVVTGPDGALWYTDPANSAIGRLDPANPTGTVAYLVNSSTSNISIGINILSSQIVSSAGWLWFTEASFLGGGEVATSGVGLFNPTTNQFSEIVFPNSAGKKPLDIAVGADGNIWVSLVSATTSGGNLVVNSAGMVRIDVAHNNAVTEFPLSAPVVPANASLPNAYRITSGPDGNIWFSDAQNGQIGVFDITTHDVSYQQLPTAGAQPAGVITGPDGNIWYSDSTGVMGRIIEATRLSIQTQPPASLNPGTPFSVVVRAVSNSGVVDTTYAGNVTIALAGGAAGLAGITTVQAVKGVATFPNLTLANSGSGYALTVSGSGLAGTTTSVINVTQPFQSATKLVIVSQPPSSLTTGTPFSVVVRAVNDAGAVDPTFNGAVTIALAGGAGGLGGTTTVQAVNGVATFSNLTLANAGNGLALVLSSTGLTGASSTAIIAQNPIPPSPVVVSSSIVMNPPKNKRGKATFGGFQIVFNSAMDGASLGNGNNYTLRAMVQVTQKVGKKRVKTLRPNKPVAFSLQIVNSTTIRLVTTNTKVYKLGGQITLIGTAPGGIKSAAGGYLGSVGGLDMTFSISKNAKSITRIA